MGCVLIWYCSIREQIAAPSHFIALLKYTWSIMLSNWEKGGSAQTAEQRQRKQLCQCKQQSDYL